jgi:hypothetical protein
MELWGKSLSLEICVAGIIRYKITLGSFTRAVQRPY